VQSGGAMKHAPRYINKQNFIIMKPTKKELATKLYDLVKCYENVKFSTVYQKSFYNTEKNALRYIGYAHNYTQPIN